jgi:hypothetical protein
MTYVRIYALAYVCDGLKGVSDMTGRRFVK